MIKNFTRPDVFGIIFLISLITAFFSCSGNNNKAAKHHPYVGDIQGYTPGTTPVSSLGGAPSSKASAHTVNVNAITGIDPADISTDPATGIKIAVTSFQIRLAKSATVGEVNALLASLNGQVISMFEGAPFLLVRIPNPGGLAEYNEIIAGLEANPLVEYVSPGYFPAVRGLPPNHVFDDENRDKISHQLAVGAHAAWHVRYLADMSLMPPHLIIADEFGDGDPGAAFNIAWGGSNPLFGFNNPHNHGYGVLGVILARFGGDSSDRGLQTGMYPSSLTITGIDSIHAAEVSSDPSHTFNAVEEQIIHDLKSQSGRPIIVNTSIGFPCKTSAEAGKYCTEDFAMKEGENWLIEVRDEGLEDSFIHVTAAGNISEDADGFIESMYDSPFAAARFIDKFAIPPLNTPPLKNILVVENLVHAGSLTDPYEPVCLSNESKFPGDIAAIGHSVSSLNSSSDPKGSQFFKGTSFSAPQVAGVAAYIWALDPTLSAMSVINRIKRTSRASVSGSAADCSATKSAPVLDAYSAVLSVDSVLSPTLAPVRAELMDVADDAGVPGRNDQFDEEDIQLLLGMFDLQNGTLDYSRYDLNGDGYTGGTETEQFDLDLDVVYGTADQTIGGLSIDFDENAVTDQEILCYYAYSLLYTGDSAKREELLRGRCADECIVDVGDFAWDLNEAGHVSAKRFGSDGPGFPGGFGGYVLVDGVAVHLRELCGIVPRRGVSTGSPLAINDAGQVVVWAQSLYLCENGSYTRLSETYNVMPGWENECSIPGYWHQASQVADGMNGGAVLMGIAINDSGTIVAGDCTWSADGSASLPITRGTLEAPYCGYGDGECTGICGNYYVSDITNTGAMCGWGNAEALYYDSSCTNYAEMPHNGGIISFDGTLTLHGLLDPRYDDNYELLAYAINEEGQMVGTARAGAEDEDALHAVFVDGPSILSLGQGYAWDINNSSHAVGTLITDAEPTAFLYDSANSKMQDLNAYLPEDSPWVLEHGFRINNAGLILGYGKMAGADKAFLMDRANCPQPPD